jgi:hypothetical protein
LRHLALLADAGQEGERVDTGEEFWLGGVINAGDSDNGRVIRMRHVRTWISADG